MADEVFALSPISARAVQPSEADYDAIKEAFMETSRGRWFLGEYAKRNRNTDTKMVLDAVARIEETLAAQKKPERDPLLDEALAAFRVALTEAREATTAALGDLALEQNLAPVRKGARVIREIAWRLREIGADSRICDLIDSQVEAIEGATGKLKPADLAGALSEALDRIEGKIAAFGGSEAAASFSPPEPMPPQAFEATPVANVQAETQAEAQTESEVEARTELRSEEPTEASDAKPVSAIEAVAEAAATAPAAADASPVAAAEETPIMAAASEPIDAFDAGDEAMLDMVALEMAAPDTDEAYEPQLDEPPTETGELQVGAAEAREGSEAQISEEEISATEISESAAPDEVDVSVEEPRNAAPVLATALPAVTPLQSAPEPELVFAAEVAPSLGSSLLANGIVPRPRAARPDPMAPIRRMTQTEKIAFFS